MTHRDTIRAFRRRRLERGVALVPLAASWIGLAWLKAVARPYSGVDGTTFWWVLGGVALLTVLLIAFTIARWRCPACGASLWGRPRPTACLGCGAPLRDT